MWVNIFKSSLTVSHIQMEERYENLGTFHFRSTTSFFQCMLNTLNVTLWDITAVTWRDWGNTSLMSFWCSNGSGQQVVLIDLLLPVSSYSAIWLITVGILEWECQCTCQSFIFSQFTLDASCSILWLGRFTLYWSWSPAAWRCTHSLEFCLSSHCSFNCPPPHCPRCTLTQMICWMAMFETEVQFTFTTKHWNYFFHTAVLGWTLICKNLEWQYHNKRSIQFSCFTTSFSFLWLLLLRMLSFPIFITY
jgi:hypothetical protein